MLTFRGKALYFEITLIKSFFAHIHKNINISRKNDFSLEDFEKIIFSHMSQSINISRKRTQF